MCRRRAALWASAMPPAATGRAGARTRDCQRNGTASLSAAPSTPDRTMIGGNLHRRRHREFIRLLDEAERSLPAGSEIHAFLRNHAAHTRKGPCMLGRAVVAGFLAKLTRPRQPCQRPITTRR